MRQPSNLTCRRRHEDLQWELMEKAEEQTNWVLMTVELEGEFPTLAQISQVTGLAVSDLNQKFGVIIIDRDKGLFAFQAKADAVAKIDECTEKGVKGPFSNTRIEPLN